MEITAGTGNLGIHEGNVWHVELARAVSGVWCVRRGVVFFVDWPDVEPCSATSVPFLPEEERFDLRGTSADLAQIASALTTLLFVISRF